MPPADGRAIEEPVAGRDPVGLDANPACARVFQADHPRRREHGLRCAAVRRVAGEGARAQNDAPRTAVAPTGETAHRVPRSVLQKAPPRAGRPARRQPQPSGPDGLAAPPCRRARLAYRPVLRRRQAQAMGAPAADRRRVEVVLDTDDVAVRAIAVRAAHRPALVRAPGALPVPHAVARPVAAACKDNQRLLDTLLQPTPVVLVGPPTNRHRSISSCLIVRAVESLINRHRQLPTARVAAPQPLLSMVPTPPSCPD